jgi:metallo-beta-lactamase family protein
MLDIKKLYRASILILCITIFTTNCIYLQLTEVNVQLLGAARQVSGSSYYIDTNINDVLIDCGIFYPEDQSIDYDLDKSNTDEKNTKLDIDVATIDAIILTHAHLDHLGKVPLAYKKGFRGKIYSTNQTFKIAEIMFENMILKSSNLGKEKFIKSANSDKHHSHPNCKWKNKIKEPRTVTANRKALPYDGICKICIGLETRDIMDMFVVLGYNKPKELFEGFTVELFDARHIPGSSSILITMDVNGSEHIVYFSGDVGSGINGLLTGYPNKPREVDYIFMESTYGNHSRKKEDKSFDAFYNQVQEDLYNKQRIWIPAFTLDRTQRVLNQLRYGIQIGEIDNLPAVFALSTTAKKINTLYDQYFDFRPSTLNESYSMSPKYFEYLDVKPSITITPSYIDDLDFFHPFVKSVITDKRASIYLVGYQDPRSIGGSLKNDDRVKLGARFIKVNAKISKFSSFSGHLDGQGVIDYLSDMKINESIFLTHGEYQGMLELKERIEALDKNCIIPDYKWKLHIK